MNGQMPPHVEIQPFDAKAKLKEAEINMANNKINMQIEEVVIEKLRELAK